MASLPDVTSANLTQMRAISEPFEVKAHTGKRGRKSDPAHTGGGAMPGKSGQGRKPPKIGGFEWYKQGAGWACRSVAIVDGKRTRRYLGYLSGKAWADMQKNHSGPELRGAVKQWLEGREAGRAG